VTVGRRRQFEEQAVVRAARDLLWEKGYASTSLTDLELATGLNRSSLYQAFGSKSALFGRAVQSYCEEVLWPLIEPMEADDAGADEIAAYFLALASRIRKSARQTAGRGCLVTNTATELNILDDAVAGMVRNYRKRLHGAITNALNAIDGLDHPDRKAEVLTAAQMGLMITARFNPTAAAETAETIAADVRTW
jgi:TetR/AcrR family transcriptional regulator, transcriptional repressor for nem operon